MNRFGIGQPVRRVEDARFLRGLGRYVDDIHFPGECHAVSVLSQYPHARIRRIDASQALAVEGVLCVLTGADAAKDGLGGFPPHFMPEDRGGPKGYRTLRPVLVADRVRCVGDRVAFVVAETLAAARDAAELIDIDYEPLDAVTNLEAAVKPGAPSIWDDCPGNVSFVLEMGDKAATDAAFETAAHVVAARLENNRLAPSALEPRCAIGQYDAAQGTYTLHTSSQNPHGVRTMLCRAIFGMPETRLRVVAPDVGGGFGLKTNPYPEDALVLWASRRCGRPVRWTATRSDSFLGDNHGRDQVIHGELALDGSGRILGVRAKGLHAVGAYTFSACVAPIEFSLFLIPNVYQVPTLHLVTSAVFTNTSPLGAYRGAGRPEAVYLIERLVEAGARKLGIDAAEIRRRNFIPPEKMPYHTLTGMVYDSGEFERVMTRCQKLADWDGFPARRKASADTGRLRGRGMAFYIEQGGRFNDRMELRFDPSGALTILAGTHSHGQGHATTYAQMVCDWLGVPFESIRFVQGDTGEVAYGRGTFAARSSLLGGNALRVAAEAIVSKARPMAAHLLEASAKDLVFEEGSFSIAGTDRRIPLAEVAAAFYRPAGVPKEFGVGLDAGGSWSAEPPNHPNGCHVCEVEIDASTGALAVERYTIVDDVGRVINPMICEGQVHGGLAQGIGQAVLESVVYDPESGQLLTGSFLDYAMPRADDMPEVCVAFEEIPATTNPLGVKGIGEAGSVGSPAAVINALIDALAPLGVESFDMPATPMRVWNAIQSART